MFLARDKDKYFCLFGEMPVRDESRDVWVQQYDTDDLVRLGYELEGFNDMSWDDDPIEVDIEIIRKNLDNKINKEIMEFSDFDAKKWTNTTEEDKKHLMQRILEVANEISKRGRKSEAKYLGLPIWSLNVMYRHWSEIEADGGLSTDFLEKHRDEFNEEYYKIMREEIMKNFNRWV